MLFPQATLFTKKNAYWVGGGVVLKIGEGMKVVVDCFEALYLGAYKSELFMRGGGVACPAMR